MVKAASAVSQLRDKEGEGRAGRCSHSIFTTVIINQKTFSFVLMGGLMGSEIELPEASWSGLPFAAGPTSHQDPSCGCSESFLIGC